MAEQVDHFQSSDTNIPGTMQMSDYFAWSGNPLEEDCKAEESLYKMSEVRRKAEKRCYQLDSAINLSHPDVKDGEGLSQMVDELLLLNPTFAQVTQIADMDADNFLMRENQRPAGYSATTRIHMGRLCVPALNDSGASCACITEEQVVILINHTQRMVKEGKLSPDDYNFPLRQFYKYKKPARGYS